MAVFLASSCSCSFFLARVLPAITVDTCAFCLISSYISICGCPWCRIELWLVAITFTFLPSLRADIEASEMTIITEWRLEAKVPVKRPVWLGASAWRLPRAKFALVCQVASGCQCCRARSPLYEASSLWSSAPLLVGFPPARFLCPLWLISTFRGTIGHIARPLIV